MATKWTNTNNHRPTCGVRGKKTSQGNGNISRTKVTNVALRNIEDKVDER
jgi:hypothetical protein